MSDPHSAPGTATNNTARMRAITRDWYLMLSASRRQASMLDPDTIWMRNKLEDLLAEMDRKARRDAQVEVLWTDVRPILVYLADEVLLTSGWAGEDAWADSLLETAHYGTQHAGQDFFVRLDKALAANRPEVLEVFFKALCLGFKGQYLKQPTELQNIRRDLFRRIPSHKFAGLRLCPEAYEATDERRFQKLPVVAVARVVVGLLAFLIIITVAASFYFKDRVSIINELSEQAIGTTTDPDLPEDD